MFFGSLIYGTSRFINGYVVDRVKSHIVMALGLFLCAMANFAFGFSVNISALITGTESGPDFTSMLILFMGIVIILNQYCQGMGYPPCARILPHWIHPSELATKMSIWNTSHSVGAAFAVIVCGTIMGSLGTDMSANADVVARIAENLTNNNVADASTQALNYAAHIGAWKWCFWIPAIIALCGSVFVLMGLRDEPKDAGLPDLPGTSLGKIDVQNKKDRKKFEMEMVWKNRWVLYTHFARILKYAALKEKNRYPDRTAVAAALQGVNPYFWKEYDIAVANYPVRKAMEVISLLCEYDYKGKGGDAGEATPGELLVELTSKILSI